MKSKIRWGPVLIAVVLVLALAVPVGAVGKQIFDWVVTQNLTVQKTATLNDATITDATITSATITNLTAPNFITTTANLILTGSLSSDTSLTVNGWAAVAAPTAIASATPAALINSLGVSALLEVQDGGSAVFQIANGGNITRNGGDTLSNWSRIAAPTSIASATPAAVVDSAGVSNILEIRDAATPVAFFPNGGGLTIVSGGETITAGGLTVTAGTAAFHDAVTQDLVNAASGSANPWDYTGTLGIMNGSDDFTLFDVNITNANHTGSNTVQGLDIAAITGDAEATESAIKIGAGWDSGITTASGVTISAGGASIVGQVDVGDWVNLSGQTGLVLINGGIITPTGTYQPISSASSVNITGTVAIADGAEAGDVLILRNANASDTIVIDGTGSNVECKSDKTLGASDVLTLIWNGSDWNCISLADNI